MVASGGGSCHFLRSSGRTPRRDLFPPNLLESKIRGESERKRKPATKRLMMRAAQRNYVEDEESGVDSRRGGDDGRRKGEKMLFWRSKENDVSQQKRLGKRRCINTSDDPSTINIKMKQN